MWEADREPDRDEKREREEGEEAVLRHSPALIGRDLSSYVQSDDGNVPTPNLQHIKLFCLKATLAS